MDIDNVRENARQVTYYYAVDDLVYVEMTGIYHKLDYKKQGLYTITELFTNGTVKVQRGQLKKHKYKTVDASLC